MPRFIAVHPGSFPEADLAGLAQRRGEMPAGVTWLLHVVRDRRGRHVLRLGSARRRRRSPACLESFQVPVDAIHEVRYFEPDAGKFVA